jgi:hypothetical protein
MSVDLFINMYAFIVVMIGCGLGLIVAATTILCTSQKEQVVHTSDIEMPEIKLA